MPNNTASTVRSMFIKLQAHLESMDMEVLNSEQHLVISEALGLCGQISKLLLHPSADRELALLTTAESRPVASVPSSAQQPTLQPPAASPAAPTSAAPAPFLQPLAPAIPLHPSQASGKRTILIIDDDTDIHKVLVFLLKRKGQFEVLSETNPVRALENLTAAKFAPMPDIILMDLMMPQMTGFDLLARIRSQANLASIRIMIGSSRSYDKDRIAVLQAGANDFIAKPYNFEELLLRLGKLAA